MNLLIKMGKQIAKHKFLILLIGFLLLIPSLIGMVTTRVNYDLLSYLPETLETVKGQDIMVDEYGMGAFSMVVVENMELKDVQKLEKKFEAVDHVKDVLWYDDVADLNLPVQMIPKKLREGFFKGNATMMIVLFDNTTSSDESMNAVAEMRKLANKQCFISGMSGVVNDIKDVALDELPVYVVIAAHRQSGRAAHRQPVPAGPPFTGHYQLSAVRRHLCLGRLRLLQGPPQPRA